jgi:predicted transcriptional regulator
LPTSELFVKNTATIVASYVAQHKIATFTLPDVIRDVFDTLTSLTEQLEAQAQPTTSVELTKSVYPDYIICLEDGKRLTMLKRHLWTSYKMTPDEYRAKWGLPPSYPMTAPNYTKLRASLAKKTGLGRQRWTVSPKRGGAKKNSPTE